MCVTLMNPRTGGVFASFGAHPSLEVALERSLTELLQGRSLEGLNDLPPPTFVSEAVTEPNNFVEHFNSTRAASYLGASSVQNRITNLLIGIFLARAKIQILKRQKFYLAS